MSGFYRPNILKRKNINVHKNEKEKEAALSQNILENSEYYQKHINICNDGKKNALKSNCKDKASVPRVKRKRKNSPTSQKCDIDLDDVARVDREARLAFKNQSILGEPLPDTRSITTSHDKPMFSEVEFLDENVENIESWEDEPTDPHIEETNYPRTVHDKFEWKIINEINAEQSRRNLFTGKPGPVTEFGTPYDAFTAIWNHNVLEEILKTTNKHGEALNKANRESGESNRPREPWTDITIAELYIYLAIVMSTASCTKLSFRAYFSTNPDINRTPFYSKYMSCQRFSRINQALCFIDQKSLQETELKEYEKRTLAIEPLVDLLNERFSSLYSLHQNIVVEKIKSVNIISHYRKFERLLGLFDSSTGYCWQLNYIIDEVPKYTRLLQRYAKSQCRNVEISPNDSLPKHPTVYVKSLKKRIISEKESNSNNNETTSKKKPKESKNTPVTIDKNCDLNTAAINDDPKRSKHDNITSKKKSKATKNTAKTLNKNCDFNTTAINNDPERCKRDSKDTPIAAKSNADKLKSSETSLIQFDQPDKGEKLQDEILYDEDLPPLARPIPSTVLNFVKNLHFKGHTLFMDWSFQSPPLARTLKSIGIDCVGSFRGNTQYAPKDIKPYIDGKHKLIPGQVLGYTSEDIDIILWNERRILTLISTYHGLATVGETNLQSAVDYNFAMSVVDRFNKNMKSLSFNAFGKTELKVYVSSLLKISLINAYILYQNSKAKMINLHEFVQEVVKGILGHHGNDKVFIDRIMVNVSSNLRDHLPIVLKKPWPICEFCVKDDKAVYECVGCKKYLCVKCFTKYHETIATRIISE